MGARSLRRPWFALLLSCLCGAVFGAAADAQQRVDGSTSSVDLGALRWREIGPVHLGGRIMTLAVPAAQGAGGRRPGTTFFIGGPGGLFKTDNAGVTWTPLFDGQAVSVVHTAAVSPVSSNLIWVGTGDPIFGHQATPGNGVYKSEDGGRTWVNVGFTGTEFIGKIAAHPAQRDVALVAVIGPLTRPSRERGLYRTADGGKTWTQTLFVNEWTGGIDLSFDPHDPAVVYAAMWEQRNGPASIVDHGPGSGVYKSVDGGATWRRLTSGLPSGAMGRIDVAVSPAAPGLVYARIPDASAYQADGKGTRHVAVYRSTDYGESWELRTTHDRWNWSGYTSGIYPDPRRADRLYFGEPSLMVTEDGGATIQRTPTAAHADVHDVWIDPTDSDHMIVADDGGIWITYDRARTWRHVENLSLTLNRAVDADRRPFAYHVHEESQDHGTYGGPSRTHHSDGIIASDWYETYGGEHGAVAVDPDDPNVIYTLSAYTLVRFDRRLAFPQDVGPSPLARQRMPVHYETAPITISPHDRQIIYTGDTRAWKSTDGGQHWTQLTDDLVPVPPDERPDLMAAWYRTISTLAESPAARDVLWLGTQSGLLQVSRDGGKQWARVTVSGVPRDLQVSRVTPSVTAPGTAYVTFHGATIGDFRPYVFKTTDFGARWTPLVRGLPPTAAVWVVREHPSTPQLLFAATDVGVFYSLDAGANWAPLRNGMPAVRVRDLVVQPTANDLVIGTYGRGMWIMDDITPLEQLARAGSRREPLLFPVRDAWFYEEDDIESRFNTPRHAAPNPPYGAIVTYHLPTTVRAADVVLEVLDSTGQRLRLLPVDTVAGFHRTAWNLRALLTASQKEDSWWSQYDPPAGVAVAPGLYRVRLSVAGPKGADTSVAIVRVHGDPRAPLAPPVRDSLLLARRTVQRLEETRRGAQATAERLRTEAAAARDALASWGGPASLRAHTDSLLATLDSVLTQLRYAPSAQDRRLDEPQTLDLAIRTAQHKLRVDAPVSPATWQTIALLVQRTGTAVDQVNALLRRQMPALQAALDAAGVPWSDGRSVPREGLGRNQARPAAAESSPVP